MSSSSSKTENKSSKGALKLEVPKVTNPPKIGGGIMPKVEEFYHLREDGEEAAQFCVENEYEDDDENDAYEIVNPTRPRSRAR
jgi:hypothetical protein